MAIKVIGVEGENLAPNDPNAVTQDFLIVNDKTFAVADIAAFSREIQLLAKVTIQLPGLQKATTTLAPVGGVGKPDGVDGRKCTRPIRRFCAI